MPRTSLSPCTVFNDGSIPGATAASVSSWPSRTRRQQQDSGKLNRRVVQVLWLLIGTFCWCFSSPLQYVQARPSSSNHNHNHNYHTNSRGGASNRKQQCLYSLLGVSKTCSPQDLKKAYRRAALRAHPDKPGGNEETFKQVSQAYEVLSDPEQRLRYDRYGFVGDNTPNNNNAPPNFGSQSAHPQGFSFDSSQIPPEFANFFQTQQQQSSSSFGLDDWLRQMMMGGAATNRNTQRRPGFGTRRPRKRKPVTRPLKVSIADVFLGKTKTVTLSFGRGRTETYTVSLKPFWKPGTKITFPQRHTQRRTIPPVTFVLEHIPHSTLERRGDDLVYRHRVVSKDTTSSSSSKKKTKPLRLSIALPDGVVWRRTVPPERAAHFLQPGRTITVPDMGMPTKDGGRGSLIVEFV